ncbi:MAG: hypothetical protein AB1384_12475 [Actinomycetota bacterium]
MRTDFTIQRYRTLDIDGVAKDSDGNVMSLASPAGIMFMMVNVLDPDNVEKGITKMSIPGGGIVITDSPAGKYRIHFDPEDTQGLPVGDYRYEVMYSDDIVSTNEAYTLNPTSVQQGILELKDSLIEDL